MSLYNILYGENADANKLLNLLKLGSTYPMPPRYRDCWIDKDKKQIIVYTRAGGGNREHHDEETEPGEGCGCWGCEMQFVIPKHPQYSHDEDDSYDCTYAKIYYDMPPTEIDSSRDDKSGS